MRGMGMASATRVVALVSSMTLAAVACTISASPASAQGSAGAQLWVKRYYPGSYDVHAVSAAVSSDGSKVYVTGQSVGNFSGSDYATIAYDATSGTRLWVKRYNGPGNSDDRASSVA